MKDKGPVSFSLASTTSTSVQESAQFLAESFKAAGMDVKLDTVEQTALITSGLTGNYQAALWRQFGSQDPDGDYVWALDKGRSNPDENIGKEGYADFQRRLTADLPYLWLAHVQWGIAADLSVRGVVDQTMPDGTKSAGVITGVHRLTEVWLDH